MSLRPCLTCGDLIESGSYCLAHHPDRRRRRVTPGRRRAAEFRAKVLKRDGYRCRALLPNGSRCAVDDPAQLEAHLRAVRDGGRNTLRTGVTLCRPITASSNRLRSNPNRSVIVCAESGGERDRMRRFAGTAAVVVMAASGCGGEDSSEKKKPQQDARSPAVQKRVQAQIKRETEKRIESETGAYVDPELQDTTSECIPESDTKLSCTVEGFAQAGFGDTADPDAEGEFAWEWSVIVDPATGRFKAKPTETPLPGGF